MNGFDLALAMKPESAFLRVGTSDWYEPETATIHLSRTTAGSETAEALFDSAHECGHAIQHASDYHSYRVWSSVVGQGMLFPALTFLFTAGLLSAGAPAWKVAASALLPMTLRIGVILWIEWEASAIAVKLLCMCKIKLDKTIKARSREMLFSYLNVLKRIR